MGEKKCLVTIEPLHDRIVDKQSGASDLASSFQQVGLTNIGFSN